MRNLELNLTQLNVVEAAPGYWRATFSHPPKNLMNSVTATELRTLVEAAEKAEDLRVLVFDSADVDYFFARYDLSAGPLPTVASPTGLPFFIDFTVRLSTLPVISIAQIAGRARGGGNELALACDLRYAALETAVLGQPEIGSALVPAGGAMERLVPLVGRSRALEITVTGQDYDAETAERYGWITQALPAARLAEYVDALASRIARFDGYALAAVKELAGRSALPDASALKESADAAARLAVGPGFRPALQKVRSQARRAGDDFDLNMGQHIADAYQDHPTEAY
ncbi:enoyl-CoA hydratase/isomerase family protein [Streptomyces sp. NPDC090080]|uniref:enoyl-CoA hydratase/isomerase family protein n=1 Tax=Streptomyces sp. NPDC090080 TaxID=3365939 RepID=UPI003818D466